jgi:CheY-like chemotaxis protein
MRTILVIDDHIPTLESLCLVLSGRNYRTLPAENAAQASAMFAANEVDLVIVDHGLPGVSGSELADPFKRLRLVPVLMLSGSALLQARPDSVDLLLAKPCSVPELMEGIESLLPSPNL